MSNQNQQPKRSEHYQAKDSGEHAAAALQQLVDRVGTVVGGTLMGGGLLTAALVFVCPDLASSGEREMAAPDAEVVAAAELPREWRWESEALDFDRMFRSRR